MGIDVYLNWEGKTKEDHDAQMTGFSIEHGHTGYLREAYHGGPYATKVLMPEAFEYPDTSGWSDEMIDAYEGVKIPAKKLRKRLPETLKTVIKRSKKIYHEIVTESDPVCKSFVDFVELAERKEKETGIPCRVYVSA